MEKEKALDLLEEAIWNANAPSYKREDYNEALKTIKNLLT